MPTVTTYLFAYTWKQRENSICVLLYIVLTLFFVDFFVGQEWSIQNTLGAIQHQSLRRKRNRRGTSLVLVGALQRGGSVQRNASLRG